MLSYEEFRLEAGKSTSASELYKDKFLPIKMTVVFHLYLKYLSTMRNISIRQFVINALEFYIKEKILK